MKFILSGLRWKLDGGLAKNRLMTKSDCDKSLLYSCFLSDTSSKFKKYFIDTDLNASVIFKCLLDSIVNSLPWQLEMFSCVLHYFLPVDLRERTPHLDNGNGILVPVAVLQSPCKAGLKYTNLIIIYCILTVTDIHNF